MENPQNNSNRPLRFQTPIAVLAIAAMILITIDSLGNFLVVSTHGNGSITYSFSLTSMESFFDKHSHYMLYTIAGLLYSFVSVAAPLLFVLYLFIFQKRNQAFFLLPVILGLLAASPLFAFGTDYSIFLRWHYDQNISFFEFFSWVSLLFPLLRILSFTLAAVFSRKKPANKIFLIVAVVIHLSLELYSLIVFLCNSAAYYIENSFFLFLVLPIIHAIGSICLCAALLLLVVPKPRPKNTRRHMSPVYPAPIYPDPEQVSYGNPAPMNPFPVQPASDPEHILRQLNADYESGKISAEEYRARRSQIIDLL